MRPSAACLVLSCLSALVTSTAWADPTDVSAVFTASISGRGGVDGSDYSIAPGSLIDFGPVTASVTRGPLSGGDGVATGTVSGSAFAKHPADRGEIGILGMDMKGSFTASRTSTGGTSFFPAGQMTVSANAIAEYHDDVTFLFGDTNNDPLMMEGVVFLSGVTELEAVATGGINPNNVIARVFAKLSGTNSPPTILGATMNGTGQVTLPTPDADNILGINPGISFSYLFVSGIPSPLFLKFEMGGAAELGDVSFVTQQAGFAHASFEAHYSNTLKWGGITKVVNLRTGQEVTDYQIISASGFDYTQTFSVPEPGSFAMLLLGVGVLCCCGRRYVSAVFRSR